MEIDILQSNSTKLSGKEQAKINTRIRFYTKLERVCKQIPQEKLTETFIPIGINNKVNIPTFDDITLILEKDSKITNINSDFKIDEGDILQLPYLDELHFLVEKSHAHLIELARQESFVNDDMTLRKGSSNNNDSYNYQPAYRYGFKILDLEKFLIEITKEKQAPKTYEIEVKMKKIETNVRYKKAWQPPQRRKR